MDCRVQQTSLSMRFPRQEYWSGLPFPSSGDPPNPGSKPRSPALQADSLPTKPTGKPDYLRLLSQPYSLSSSKESKYYWIPNSSRHFDQRSTCKCKDLEGASRGPGFLSFQLGNEVAPKITGTSLLQMRT